MSDGGVGKVIVTWAQDYPDSEYDVILNVKGGHAEIDAVSPGSVSIQTFAYGGTPEDAIDAIDIRISALDSLASHLPSQYEEESLTIHAGSPILHDTFLELTGGSHLVVQGDPTGTKGAMQTPIDNIEAMEFAAIRYLWEHGYIMEVLGGENPNTFLFDSSEFADRIRAAYGRLFTQ